MTEQPKAPPAKIVRTFTCERCAAQLKSDAEYKQHKIDHSLGKIADRKIDPIAGPIEETPVQDATVLPTAEQKAQAPWNAQGKVPKTATEAQIEKTTSLPKQESITLKYIYTGTCPSCNTVVETIPLDVEVDKAKKFVVIAWCGSCKNNIQQRIVTRL